jgi:D-alanyl-D-alanine carboxypeptidase/D-alanyl-D-alanine-endopeptidase (penicillin-binding protein 4)
MRRLALALALATSPSLAIAQSAPLAERVARVMDRPEFRHAFWGIELWSLDSNRVVYVHNEDKLFTPGSTTKLLTEGTALGVLGADHRFTTRIYRTGPVKGGVLQGDLVLVASGDPNLSGRIQPDGTLAFENEDHSYDASPDTRAVPGDPLLVIREMAAQVAAKGIRSVAGRVIVDASLFREGNRELGTGVVMSPIVVNDNLVDVMIGPGAAAGAPATLSMSPSTSYVRFVNRVTTGAPGTRPHVRWSSDDEGPDGTRVVTATGSFPLGTKAILYTYAVASPTRFAEITLAEALRKAGVSARARLATTKPDLGRLKSSYTSANVVAEHVSPPLAEEVKVTLKVSQNLHASMTPFVIAALKRRDSTQTGFDIERKFLSGMGLDLSGAQQGDGAGGDAHFTPSFMVSYLAAMAKRPDFRVFHDALPILGKDGTLFNIQPQSAAAGHVFAKTGTFATDDPLNRRLLVTGKGLAGYMTTASGERMAFALYVNNVSVSATDPDAVTKVVGQALGEIAATMYEGR